MKIITVDGPSGVGKGTLCELLCEFTGFHFLDSGAIYRTLAHGALTKNIALDDVVKLKDLALNLPVEFVEQKILFEGEDISQTIRTEEVAGVASQLAAQGELRKALLQRQRDFAQEPGLVADGRDMGTVVFPMADLKLYLTASAEIRAERRVNQLKNQGLDANIDRIVCEIRERDERDQNREISPLIPADDAVCITTDNLSIEQVFLQAKEIIQENGII